MKKPTPETRSRWPVRIRKDSDNEKVRADREPMLIGKLLEPQGFIGVYPSYIEAIAAVAATQE